MKKINNNALRLKDVDKVITLYGFAADIRKMGSRIFVVLRDRWGNTQLVFENMPIDFPKESVLEIHGIVKPRPQKDVNIHLPTGEIEVLVQEYKVLSLAQHELPFVIKNDLQADENTRLKYRYLDLRRPVMQEKFLFRHNLMKGIREYLEKEAFVEIETPYLSKSTPEGARDFLVPTRHYGKFFALPQSPQMYKQILMAAGFEKYFQIVRAFRDEDNRKDRGPEFTQLDIEMSFVNEAIIKSLIEKMLVQTLAKCNIKITAPFQNLDYDEAIDQYGSDKPDLRFDYPLIELTKYFAETSFTSFKKAKTIKGLIIDSPLSPNDVKILENIAKQNHAKGMMWANFDGKKTGLGWKFLELELLSIQKDWELTNHTIIMVGDSYQVATQALGAIRNKCNEIFHWVKQSDNAFKFAWINNFPLFEYDEMTKRYVAAHHPFTMPQDKNVSDFEKNQQHAKARAYDLVCNGYELGGGSIRINNLDLQMRMFKTIGLDEEAIQEKFGFFLEAFKYGLPPHGGIALGMDRLTMVLTHADSLRDVIAFPKNANGIAVMENAPSPVYQNQLDEYALSIKKINKD